MYNINETFNLNEATYDYDAWCHVRDAQTFCEDVNLPDNTVTAILGGTVNMMIQFGELDLSDVSFTSPLTNSVFYIFRKALSGKLVPLHVSMMPKTSANLERGSRKYGSMKIDAEVFGN